MASARLVKEKGEDDLLLDGCSASEEETQTDEEEIIIGLTPTVIRKWFPGVTHDFVYAASLSTRVAAWVAVYSVSTVVLGRGRFAEMGFDMSSILCNVLFIVGSDVGSTISNCFYGIIGTFWSWLTLFLLHGIWPKGYDGSNPEVFWIGTIIIVLYTNLFLFLNVNSSVRFFALLNFTGGFAMDFVDPRATKGFSEGFKFDYRAKVENAAVLYIIASALALAIFILPLPLTALGKAQKRLKGSIEDVHISQHQLFHYYCGHSKSLKIHDVVGKFQGVKDDIASCKSHSEHSWYESFGKSKRRQLTEKLLRMMEQVVQRYEPIFPVVIDENFEPSHFAMMRTIEEPLRAVIEEVHTLVHRCTNAAMDGRLDEEEMHDMQALLDKMPSTVETLQAAVKKTSEQFGTEPVNRTLLGEHFFVYTMCIMAQEACNNAQDILSHKVHRAGWQSQFVSTVSNVFVVSRDDMWWAVRSSIAILFNFGLGYHGWCNGPDMDEYGATPAADREGSPPSCFINKYTPGLASINVILLSRMSGSTFKSGLNRVNAVILAMVVGQIGFTLFGHCTWWSRIFTVMAVFSMTQIGLYLANAGGQAAAIGQRLAAIGVSALMAPCMDKSNTEETYSSSYHTLSEIIIGVIVMMVMDMIMGDKPSSKRATDKVIDAIDSLKVTFHDYMDDHIGMDDLLTQVTSITDKLGEAKMLSEDASNEPNFWRPVWRGVLVADMIQALSTLCSHMTNLAVVVGPHKEVLLNGLPCFSLIKGEFSETLDITLDVMKQVLVRHEGEEARVMSKPEQPAGFQALPQMIVDMNAQTRSQKGRMITDDHGEMHLASNSRRAVVAVTLDAMLAVLKDAQVRAVQNKNKDQ